ncbi:MAG: class I SAM-dependent methyltransferase [Candidatus Aadella gelida]|nr:class I SAM-dependent methyltransferase [Candidatus Aadella gelida]
MGNIFDELYRKYDAWYDKNRFAYLSELEAVKKVLPEKGYGLEIGVGSGRFAAPLSIAVGIDPSKKMVELARGRGVDAALGVGEELSFKDSTFDYVAIIVTLCFVQEPEKVITESARVLKPGGKIIIGIVDKESFLGKSYQEKGSIFYGHAQFFEIEEVEQMLKVAGFSGFSYYQTLFDYPEKIKSIEKPLEGYGKGGFVVINAVKKEK